MYITNKQLIFMILSPFIYLYYFCNSRQIILAYDSIITCEYFLYLEKSRRQFWSMHSM
uniref:Uncharacterized protein n=1 Tax=Lepeophtheirus salmonis TaxID=72036 RepID=A0A0K2U7P2_LEPSM